MMLKESNSLHRFQLSIKHDGRIINLVAQQKATIKMREQWEILARNGSIHLSNNRPVIEKRQLKYWSPTWRVESEQFHWQALLDKITAAIDKHMKSAK